MRKAALIILFVALLGLAGGVVIAKRSSAVASDQSNSEPWEYLVVSAPNNVNFSSPSTGSMRKEAVGFQKEAFVLEQNMDKLGSKGWELVSVVQTGQEPIFYFKRRK